MTTSRIALENALALHQQGDLAGAQAAYLALTDDADVSSDAHHLLGVLYYQQQRFNEAENHISAALAADENNAGAHTALAEILRRKGRTVLAAKHATTALSLDDTQADAQHVLALIALSDSELDTALGRLNFAISLNGEEPAYYVNRAEVFRRQYRYSAAMADYHRALKLVAEYPEALAGLAVIEELRGNVREALIWHARAETAAPAPSVGSNVLMAQAYDPAISPQEQRRQHADWGARYLGGIVEHKAFARPRNPATASRKLRVGYFAAYWRRHPMGALAANALTAHDTSRFDFFFYSNGSGADDLENQLRRTGPLVPLGRMTDADAAQRIREDRLDILVDTAGHTRGNRLGIFAHRAAPVQMHWRTAYWHAPCLPAFDWLLTDSNETPPADDEEGLTHERPLRLSNPGTVFSPHPDAPAVSDLPMITRGAPTFGCFNRLSKIGDGVLALWARLLKDLPTARLVLQAAALEDADTRDLLSRRFERAGGDPGRLSMIGHLSEAEVYGAYRDVDIALDPFPFSGSIITCEALWMGVPVISLPGPTMASRHSRGYLKSLGMETFVATSEDHYLRIAKGLVGDPDTLARLRRALRTRMKSAPLCDGPRLARALEGAFDTAWQTHADNNRSLMGRLRDLFRK